MGLIHHTDRDCRYASDDDQAALNAAGSTPSMSGKADCWDHAVAESFFATLQKELLAAGPLKTRGETRIEVAAYTEHDHNEIRRHSYLDDASPLEFELAAS